MLQKFETFANPFSLLFAGVDAKDKKVLIIGGGASAVEALEFVAHEEAEKAYVLARSEKWIIPRNPVIDILLSLNIFGSETIFSWIPENLLRLFFYRDLSDISPPRNDQGKGLFTETPMVNDEVCISMRTSILQDTTTGAPTACPVSCLTRFP